MGGRWVVLYFIVSGKIKSGEIWGGVKLDMVSEKRASVIIMFRA